MNGLTTEQRAAVAFPGHVMLTACPGSGKTRVIIARLMRAIDEVRGTPRSVACITYTNAAVYEVEGRLRSHLSPDDEPRFDVSTIHSFCLNNVLRPFRHLVPGLAKSCQILSPDSDEFAQFVTNACAGHGRYNLQRSDFEEFANLQVDRSGNPAGPSVTTGGIRPQEAVLFWKMILKAGFIDFCSILWLTFRLLRDNPFIADALASRFAAILVDEFQDTTDLQVDILSLIAQRKRTTFFLVGDPQQSIYGFAGARPDLADNFAKLINAATNLSLSGNFRSSQLIVDRAELLISRAPSMNAVGKDRACTYQPRHCQGLSAFQVITDEFLPALEAYKIPTGGAAILAPTWFSLFPLGRRLREYGVSVVGPGARPYRRNRLIAPLAEQLCGYLLEPNGRSIPAIERAVYHVLQDVTGKPPLGVLSYEGRCVVFDLIAEAQKLQQLYGGAREWLLAAAPAFANILLGAKLISPSEVSLLSFSANEILRDMQNNRVDVANLTLDDLGVYASPDAALKLVTVHTSKGREFDAVAMIDLHEGTIPHFRATSSEAVAEARRQFYVGITRAKRFLMLITDTSHHRNRPSRFLTSASGIAIC